MHGSEQIYLLCESVFSCSDHSINMGFCVIIFDMLYIVNVSNYQNDGAYMLIRKIGCKFGCPMHWTDQRNTRGYNLKLRKTIYMGLRQKQLLDSTEAVE